MVFHNANEVEWVVNTPLKRHFSALCSVSRPTDKVLDLDGLRGSRLCRFENAAGFEREGAVFHMECIGEFVFLRGPSA